MTPPKTPLELAALATAAVPGLRVAGLRPPQFSDEVHSVTGIVDVEGNAWTVVAPHDSVGGLDLEAQIAVLSRLAKAHDADYLPFDVPRPSGLANVGAGGRVMVYPDLGGRFMEEWDFEDPGLTPASLARALAALHNLPEATYTGVDLPAYSAAEVRERHMALLDEAATQATIPANLWNRWEGAIDDVALWRFRTVPVHGDLQLTSTLIDRGTLTGMTGFSSAHVGDPAVDIAWVLTQASDIFLDRFREAYAMARTATDLHLYTRAQLVSELAVVRWLVHGIHAEDESIIDEARDMIADLAADLGESSLVRQRPSVEGLLIPIPIDEGGALFSDSAEGEPVPDRSGASSPEHNTGPLEFHDLPTEPVDLGERPTD